MAAVPVTNQIPWVEIYDPTRYLVGLTRAQLSGIAREAQRHRDGVARGEERADRAVEMAQERVVPAFERQGW